MRLLVARGLPFLIVLASWGCASAPPEETPRRARDDGSAVPVAPGHVATAGAPGDGKTAIRVTVAGNVILVPVIVNGRHRATLLLDTGASVTVFNPAMLKRAGIAVPRTAPRKMITVVGGRMVPMPVVPVKSLRLGSFSVEDLDVLAYDALPATPSVDGILGTNVLNHFRFSVDRAARRLTLEIAEIRTLPVAGSLDLKLMPASVPVWRLGDQWSFRWKAGKDEGEFTWTVSAEEVRDGVGYYVVTSGSRSMYYRKADLGWHMDLVEGAVTTRAVPAFGYRWPLAHGSAWELTYRWDDVMSGKSEDRLRHCAVEAPEQIAVPAGTFMTHHVVCRDAAGRTTVESWYAPSVKQWVKQVSSPGPGERVREMIAFTVR